ncbi:hypothetical protein CBL_01570 [Carabus blaptoides fortunei]
MLYPAIQKLTFHLTLLTQDKQISSFTSCFMELKFPSTFVYPVYDLNMQLIIKPTDRLPALTPERSGKYFFKIRATEAIDKEHPLLIGASKPVARVSYITEPNQVESIGMVTLSP